MISGEKLRWFLKMIDFAGCIIRLRMRIAPCFSMVLMAPVSLLSAGFPFIGTHITPHIPQFIYKGGIRL